MASSESNDLQSWFEVPSIAHFCSLFRQAFDLLEFDIQELEESLLLMGTEDDTTKLVNRLLIRLLRGCSRSFTSNINEDNYNTYLRRLFLSKREEAEEDQIAFNFDCNALVDDDVDFQDLPLRDRVLILKQLCEFRLDAEDVFDKLRNLEASSLRVEPLGCDSEGVTFWYFYGTRLYKEVPPSTKNHDHDHKSKKHSKDKDKKKKKKDKKKKKKKKRGDSVSSAEEEEPEPTSTWSVACLTLSDWEELAAKYKKLKKKDDKDLYETLHDHFLPEIVKMFAEKEKEEKRRFLLLQPKRSSGRLEIKRKEQEEKDKEFAQKMEEQRRLEEEYDEKLRLERETREKEEREIARQERRRQRELMKELRSQRASERDVAKAIQTLKEQSAAKRREIQGHSDDDSDTEDKDDLFEPPFAQDEEDDDEAGQGHSDRSDGKSKARSNFTNALIRAGTKSTKDSMLDKPVRKMPGLLLESAGRSLLHKKAADEGSSTATKSSGITFGLASSKISFGLYEGHLPIDHSNYTKSAYDSDSGLDVKASSTDSTRPSAAEIGAFSSVGGTATKKVFSNWGGEFFKKNLDYRANTNKILEKMSLNTKPSSNGESNNSVRPPVLGSGGKSAGSLKRSSLDSISSNDGTSPTKKFQAFGSYV